MSHKDLWVLGDREQLAERVQYYRGMAEKARQAAGDTRAGDIKDGFLRLAKKWGELAEAIEGAVA
jgi:hypothetical protein